VFGRKAATPAIDGLDSAARRRLERFAWQFDDIDSGDFVLYAGPLEPDPSLQRAMDVAQELLASPKLHAAAKEAVNRFVLSAQQRYSERFDIYGLIVGTRRTASATDRVRVYRSLERAVAALVLWDRLDDQTRSLLAGPWLPVIDAAIGNE